MLAQGPVLLDESSVRTFILWTLSIRFGLMGLFKYALLPSPHANLISDLQRFYGVNTYTAPEGVGSLSPI